MEENISLVLTALWIACEDIQLANEDTPVVDIYIHYLMKAKEKILADLSPNGRQDN